MQKNKETGFVKVYYRGLDIIGGPEPEGPRLHPIMEDWDRTYYELANDKGWIKTFEGKARIRILKGKLKDMSKSTRCFFKNKPRHDERFKVDKKRFLQAVKSFAKEHEGKRYNPLDFSDNSIGFKNYVIDNSKIR